MVITPPPEAGAIPAPLPVLTLLSDTPANGASGLKTAEGSILAPHKAGEWGFDSPFAGMGDPITGAISVASPTCTGRSRASRARGSDPRLWLACFRDKHAQGES